MQNVRPFETHFLLGETSEVMSLHWQNICLTLNGRGPSNRLTRNRWSATARSHRMQCNGGNKAGESVRDFKFNSERKRGRKEGKKEGRMDGWMDG